MTGLPLAVVTLLVGSLARCGETATTIPPCTDSISVTHVLPPYGPVSGDTEVYLFGQYPWSDNAVPNITVFFGDNQQTALEYLDYSQFHSLLVVKTPPVPDSLIGERQTLYLVVHDDGCLVITDQEYEFRATPVVESITPLKSFLRGGLTQTVVGQHFDSLYPYPPLQMTTTILYLYNLLYEQQPTNCTVVNATMMTCPAPWITNTPTTDPVEPVSCGNPADLVFGCLNQPDYEFFVGLNLHSTPLYQNVSELLPDYGIMMTFVDPVVEPLEPDRFPFRVYKGENIVELKGDNLNLGWGEDQYTITVGADPCDIVSLSTNRLSCRPPQSQPHHGNYSTNKGSPQMRLTIGNYFEIPGYLAYYEKPLDDPVILNSVIGICVGVPVLVILIVLIVKLKQYMGKPLLDQGTLSVTPEIKPFLKKKENLSILKQVGKGNFGVVYSAEYKEGDKTTQVAAKTLTQSGEKVLRVRDLKEFLDEAIIMKHFEHVNVLPLIGVVDMDGRPYVLTPFMDKGDLRTFLMNNKNQITMVNQFDYSKQVAHGMSYLSSIDIVHRDLAARNCMLSNDNVVKIADFGLARRMSNDNEYETAHYVSQNKNQVLPFRWIAPEIMDTQKFTSSSDMWACGVVLWEIFSRGKLPYSDVPNSRLKHFLGIGKRLEKPKAATNELYQVMLACWQEDPGTRPTAADLVRRIQDCLRSYAAEVANGVRDHSGTQTSQIQDHLDVTRTMSEGVEPGYLLPTSLRSAPMTSPDPSTTALSGNPGPQNLMLHQDNLGYMKPDDDQEETAARYEIMAGTNNDGRMPDPAGYIFAETAGDGSKGIVSGSDPGSGNPGPHYLSLDQDELGCMKPEYDQKETAAGYEIMAASNNDVRIPDPAEAGIDGPKSIVAGAGAGSGYDKDLSINPCYRNMTDSYPDAPTDADSEAVTDNRDDDGYLQMSPTAFASHAKGPTTTTY